MNRIKIEIELLLDNEDVVWIKEDIENSLREGESLEEFKTTREE